MTKKFAVIFGIVFIIVGILGFIPNGIVGDAEGAIFKTDNVHNIVHLLVGIVLLLSAKSEGASAMWLKLFGVVYIILFINGLMNEDMLLGFIAQNKADTYLHLVLGIVLLAVGFMGGKSQPMTMDKATM